MGDAQATVTLSASGINCRCLVDSGSCRSLLRLDKFQELCDKTRRSVFLRPSVNLQGIAGGKLSVLGETEIYLDRPSCVVTVTIVSTMRYAMLLGDPEIRQGHGILDYRHCTFQWNGELLPLEMGPGDPETIHAVGIKIRSDRTCQTPAVLSTPRRQKQNKQPPPSHQTPPPTRHDTHINTITSSRTPPPHSRLDRHQIEQAECSNNPGDHTLTHHPTTHTSRSHATAAYDSYDRVDSFGDILPIIDHPAIHDTVYHHQDLFSASGEPNGRCNAVHFNIRTTGNPIALRAYRVPLHKKRLIDDCVDEMLLDGVIRPSCSAYAAPVMLVPKKDGATHFCVDYKALNNATLKDVYPLPLIDEIFDQVAGSAIYSTIDLKAGYHQIVIDEKDRHKTAFRCHRGLFEFNVMPFGLCNAPSVFQRTMDKIFQGLIGKCLYIYLDDLVIYSKDPESHAHDLHLVFERLRQAGLKMKPSKCHFGKTSVELLGYIISQEGRATNPDKVKVIQDLQAPTTVKGVRSFLGMTGYYRCVIPDYAHIAVPLVDLTKKHVRYHW